MVLILRRFLLVIFLPNATFAALAHFTNGDELIAYLNIALVAAALGVCCAYFPSMWRIMVTDAAAGKTFGAADFLSLGIFGSWFSTTLVRMFSIVWRALGKPAVMTGSDFLGYGLFISLCAAVFHMLAPAAVGGHDPSRRWVLAGGIISVVVFVALTIGYVSGIVAMD